MREKARIIWYAIQSNLSIILLFARYDEGRIFFAS